jgi:3-phosphoshikimate 1-carboxyvinyltransferase
MAVRGGGLRAIHYRSPVASAQVKSAILLAGLYAEGTTVVEERSAQGGSRDHTERMLSAMGADVRREGGAVSVARPPGGLRPLDIAVPGDVSSAAFWIALAVAHPDAELRLTGVGVNPTRTGLIDALREMGADIEVEEERASGGEPVADIVARSSRLRGATFGGDLIPRMIDEIPALAVAAVFAEGRTEIRDAAELRVKESDRVATVASELRKLGARVEELADGMIIEGTGALSGAAVDSHGDHRLAMALGVAGLLASGETAVAGAEAANVSYRDFWDHVHAVADV